MAFTTPLAQTTGAILTATYVNTYIKDNLRYLKGLDGGVAIQDSLGVGSTTAPGYPLHVRSTSTQSIMVEATNATTAPRVQLLDTFSKQWSWINGVTGYGDGKMSFYDGTGHRLVIDSANGNVGIGTTSPQTRLHGYDTISGFAHFKYDGVDTTLRTIIPDAAGDVLYNITALYVVRHSGGGTSAGSIGLAITPGASNAIYSAGGNTLVLGVTAGGSAYVQATALVSGTFKVGLWLLWI